MIDDLFSNEASSGTTVFSISEENSAGGSSYCWIESRPDGFHLFGSELGHMCGPTTSAALALHGSGFEFGLEYMEINTSLSPTQFREAIDGIDFSSVTSLRLNGDEIQSRKLNDIVALYQSEADEAERAAQTQQDQAEEEFAEEHGRSPDAQELHDWINFGRSPKF